MSNAPDFRTKHAPSIELAANANRLASEYLGGLDANEVFAATDFFGRYPECTRFKSVILEVTLEEYVRRSLAGEELAPSEIADHFPQYHTAIAKQIEVYQLLEGSSELEDEVWPEPGDTFLGLELHELLGVGAFSKVFLATEPQVGDRQVVVKVCHGAGAEAAFLGRLGHRHITPIYGLKECDRTGLSAIVMPYLARSTMADVIDRCFAIGNTPRRAADLGAAVNAVHFGTDLHLDHAQTGARFKGTFFDGVLRWALQLADALALAHQHEVCHSDIKPSNVMMTSDGNAVLVDFSMANDLAINRKTVGGTFPYMAPEQLEAFLAGNDIPVSYATDIFSFGATLYEFLTGRPPFGSPPAGLSHHATAEWLLKQQKESVESVSSINSWIPDSMSAIVMQCLALDPVIRPESATDLRDRLQRETTVTRRIQHASRRHTKKLLALCTLVIVVASFAIVYAMTPHTERDLNRGRDALFADEWVDAESHFTRALVQMPEHLRDSHIEAAALFGRGCARLETKQFDAASDDFAAARVIEKGSARSTAALAFCEARLALNSRLDLRDGDTGAEIQDALDLFEMAADNGLLTPAVRFNLLYLEYRQMLTGQIVRDEMQIDAILADLNELAEEVSDSPNVLLLLIEIGMQRVAAGEPIDTEHVDAAVEQFGDDSRVLVHAAYSYARNAQLATDPQASSRYYDMCLNYWTRAAANGATHIDWTILTSSNPRIEHDPLFSPPGPAGSAQASSSPPDLLLNPIDDMDAWTRPQIDATPVPGRSNHLESVADSTSR